MLMDICSLLGTHRLQPCYNPNSIAEKTLMSGTRFTFSEVTEIFITSTLSNLQAANAGYKFQTGNNRSGCSGPLFYFETTALEKPAGLLQVIAELDSIVLVPAPTDRQLTLISTTVAICSNVYCCKGRKVLTILPSKLCRGTGNPSMFQCSTS